MPLLVSRTHLITCYSTLCTKVVCSTSRINNLLFAPQTEPDASASIVPADDLVCVVRIVVSLAMAHQPFLRGK